MAQQDCICEKDEEAGGMVAVMATSSLDGNIRLITGDGNGPFPNMAAATAYATWIGGNNHLWNYEPVVVTTGG